MRHLISEGYVGRVLSCSLSGEKVAPMVVPDEHRWVPAAVPNGPALAIAQLLRRFGEGIRSGSTLETDFDLALGRHRLFDSLVHMSVL
jgi:hypothetical protein